MKKILVVDDIKGWRDFNTNILLELLGKESQIDVCESASEAYAKILENNSSPYDIVVTDLQMESDYCPKYAGEWFVEQIKQLPSYYKTEIIMVSASNSLKQIAKNLNIDYIPKSTAISCVSAYKELLHV